MNVPTTLPLAPNRAGADPATTTSDASPFDLLLALATAPVPEASAPPPPDTDEASVVDVDPGSSHDVHLAAMRVLAGVLVSGTATPSDQVLGGAGDPADPVADAATDAGTAPSAGGPLDESAATADVSPHEPSTAGATSADATRSATADLVQRVATTPADGVRRVATTTADGSHRAAVATVAAEPDATDGTGAPAVADADAEPPLPAATAALPRDVAAPATRPVTSPSTGAAGAAPTDLDPTATIGAPAPPADGVGTRGVLNPTVARILDLVAQLEHAPPPRVVVIDTGEIRLRLGLDAGTVQLTVLGADGTGAEELLRDAGDALAARGFDTDVDGHGGRRDDDRRDEDVPPHLSTTGPVRSRRRDGLQL